MPNINYDKPDDDVELIKLGEQLRDLREAQGLTYEDVATETHVRPHILKAIEEGRIGDFAAPVYVRGFTKAYCEYLMAGDLWKKYLQHLPTSDAPKVKKGTLHASASINHPTPIFRRSSIIWVYLVLTLAVMAAAFLLWNQHSNPNQLGNGFFLRNTQEGGGGSTPAIISPDETETREEIAATTPNNGAQPVEMTSSDATTSNTGQIAATIPSNDGGSVDLSWLDGVQNVQPSLDEQIPQAQIPDGTLLIEMRRPARLTVQQGGNVITRRSMTAEGQHASRTYQISNATSVTLSSGDAADISWYGRKYAPVGGDGGQLSLVFHPDGRVQVTEGHSSYFGNNR